MNSMMFYWFQVCDNLQWTIFSLLLFGLIGDIIYRVWAYFAFSDNNIEEEDYKKLKFRWNILFALMIILFIGCCFIPSQKTLIAMAIADRLTYENIDAATQFVINAIKQIKE